MTDTQVDVPQEGENPFEENTEEAPSSSSDENTESEKEDNPSPEGENTEENTQEEKKEEDDPHKDTPFHEHPRWKQREEEWKGKFNEQETRHQDDIKNIREEFGNLKQENIKETEIPKWFGGDKEQWDAYREDRAKEIKEAEDRVIETFKSEKTAEIKAVEEATTYMNSEIELIEDDKDLNPKGEKIDKNKLVKFVMDNDLVDSKGKWNYKAGFKMMTKSSTNLGTNKDRKKIAGATTSESTPESQPKEFKTTDDFKQNKPW